MEKRQVSVRLACAALALWFGVIGCSLLNTTPVGDVRSDTQSVDLGSASAARVQIKFSAGKLKVEGGANSLMDATFRYNVADWKPKVNYGVNGSQGELVVGSQSENIKLPVGREVINEWTIQLKDAVPLDLEIQTGAGESNLNLSALDLSTLRVEVGAGATDLDLGGNWDHDVTAQVTGGVGELSLKLPGEMGVRVNMDKALVSVTATGLTKEGDGYVNQAFGTAPNTLTLDIQAGVGTIKLVAP